MEVVGWTTPQDKPKVETPTAQETRPEVEVKIPTKGRKPKSKDDD